MPFSFDISLHIQRTITSLLAFPKWKAYVRALLAPADQIQSEFIEFQNVTLAKLSVNSQTLILQNHLIAQFGNGIYIKNYPNNSPNIYVGHVDEPSDDDDIYIGHADELGDGVFIGHKDEHRVTDYSFKVNVPNALALSDAEKARLKAIIDLYRFSSRNYNIVYY